MTPRVAILISGRGSNMAALIEDAKHERYCEIAAVLSNRPGAAGLEFAAQNGIPTVALDHKKFATREAFDLALGAELRARKIDFVALAGFMRILTPKFADDWRGQLVNIHPSLLPAFPGTRVHEQVLAAGVAITGATVQFVVPQLDSGPIIGQAAVPVMVGDTPETLAARVLEAEHKLYPLCLRMVCDGRVRLEGDRAEFNDGCPIAMWPASGPTPTVRTRTVGPEH
jgi:phosphoribosylglycinamide formyltransferase-1